MSHYERSLKNSALLPKRARSEWILLRLEGRTDGNLRVAGGVFKRRVARRQELDVCVHPDRADCVGPPRILRVPGTPRLGGRCARNLPGLPRFSRVRKK